MLCSRSASLTFFANGLSVHIQNNPSNLHESEAYGNTAKSLCERCEVSFFVRLYRNFAGILPYVKEFLCRMTEKCKQILYKVVRRALCGVALYILLYLLNSIEYKSESAPYYKHQIRFIYEVYTLKSRNGDNLKNHERQ